MSLPFIKIVSDKLSLQATLPIPDDAEVRVVSILGKARMGKSTFLNAIVSKLKSKSVKPFQTQDSDEHCTRGIDAYYCADHGLLLLDCQGLALEDSSHDPALLLFAYLVSDLILFNERMMLQNEALKLMEPICTFMTYLSLDDVEKQKPRLYFRISDCEVLKDDAAAARNLHKVIKVAYKDQYQSIRDSITTLFHPTVGIVKTEPLDKLTKVKLAHDEFLALFEDPSLGFDAAITEILSAVPRGRPGRTWKAKVPHLVQSINSNEKITIDKLDVVGAVGKLELLEWIAKVPQSLFAELPADGLHATYTTHIAPREQLRTQLLSEFARKFRNVSEAIKKPEYDKLAEKLDAPIRIALEKMRVAAEAAMRPFAERSTLVRTLTVYNVNITISSRDTTFWNSLLDGHSELEAACKDVFAPVRDFLETNLRRWKQQIQNAVQTVTEVEAAEAAEMARVVLEDAKAFQASAFATIAALESTPTQNVLLLHPQKCARLRISEQVAATAERLRKILQYHEIRVTMQRGGTLEITTNSAPFGDQQRPSTAHNAIKPAFDTFKSLVQDPALEKKLSDAITKRKEELLLGRSLDQASTTRIPDVEFIHMNTELSGHPQFITKQTMTERIFPVVLSVVKQMEKEGLLVEGDRVHMCPTPEWKKGTNIVGTWSIGKHREPAITWIFSDLYARAIAKERTKKENSLYVTPPETI